MSIDELSSPLGIKNPKIDSIVQKLTQKLPWALAGIGMSLVGFFILWALFYKDPLGGEPRIEVALNNATSVAPKNESIDPANSGGLKNRSSAKDIESESGVIVVRPGGSSAPQSVVIKAPVSNSSDVRLLDAPNERLSENSKVGILPKISSDGLKPMEGYARPLVSFVTGQKVKGRIAIIVGGLGINSTGTINTIEKLPGAISLAFAPYGSDNSNLVKRARDAGHEVLLQIPMEPFDFPNNDPGPQSLLTSVDNKSNIERLHWLMSRFSGYVGVMNYMGAKFTSESKNFAPVLREMALRGLLYLDDGSSARSMSEKLGEEQGATVLKSKKNIDAIQKPEAIAAALLALENEAAQNSFAIATATALPLTVEEISKWAKSASSRGFELVPISSIALSNHK